jgi:large subunit ribosomal protein L35
MSRKKMPKLKTKKSAKKRFKVTKSGKVLRTRAGKSHLMVGTRKKTVRKLRRKGQVHSTELKEVRRMLLAD